MEDKSLDSSTAAQNVQNVIEDLLKKNEYLLAKNDAQGYKPHSRRGRLPGEVGRNREVVFPGPGQSTTFSTGPVTQGRVSLANSRHSPQPEQTSSVSMGHLMRPKSPTRKCVIPEKDKSHFNLALMESQVGCKEGEKIFRVQEHEMVCAISSQTKFLNSEGKLMSSVDISYYWCNFCNFSTTSKSQLMQHVMEHRFHCKHCRYQSFSRADVIHHSVHAHPQFQETAAISQYCTLLSDYLRLHHPKEAQLDCQRKRRGPPEGDDDDDNGNLSEPSSKISRNGLGQGLQKGQKSYSTDFDLYDVTMEELEEGGDEEGGGLTAGDLGSKNSSATPSLTVLSAPADPVARTQTPSQGSSVVSHPGPSLSPSPVPDSGQPVITQVFSASTIPPSLAPDVPTSSNQSSGSSTVAQASPSSSSSGTYFPNSVGAGAMQQMRSNLYWSCGYCKFTSRSQSGIKDHSVRQHSGKPHRYVALIKPEEPSTPPPSKAGSVEEADANSDQAVEKEVPRESPDSVEVNQVDIGATAPPDETQVLVKQEPVSADESSAPIRVRFPTPRNQSKDTTTLKCYHCQYSSRNLGPLRNHILNRHKGKCLVGLGGANSKVFMCTRSDCTFRSSSGQTFLSHAQKCTPWMSEEAADAAGEAHLVKCLQATLEVAEETPTSAASPSPSISKVSFEKFSCNYCKDQFTSSRKAKLHVLKYHSSLCHGTKCLQALDNKKRSVLFCRWCPATGQQKAEHDHHTISCPLADRQEEEEERTSKWRKECVIDYSSTDSCQEAGEDSRAMHCSVVASVAEECTTQHDDVISDDEHFGSVHSACASATTTTTNTADWDCCQRLADPSLTAETIPQCDSVCGDDDNDELPDLDVTDPALADSNEKSEHPTFDYSDELPDLDERQSSVRDTERMSSPLADSSSAVVSHLQERLTKGKHHFRPKNKRLVKIKIKAANRQQKQVHGCQKKARHASVRKSQHHTRTPLSEVECVFCDFQTVSLRSLKSHLRNSHDIHHSFRFRSLYHSRLQVKSRFYACPSPFCPVYRYDEEDVAKHYRKQHSSQVRPYRSPTHSPSPVRDQQVSAHPPKVNPLVPKSFVCIYCDKRFRADTVAEMKYHHSSLHRGQPVILCDTVTSSARGSHLLVCDRPDCVFTTHKAQSLRKHKAIQHTHPIQTSEQVAQPLKKRFQCLYCEENYFTDNIMDMQSHHLSVHAGLSIIVRDVLAYKSRKISRLSVCDLPLCDFSTFDTEELDKHRMTHRVLDDHMRNGAERSFQCTSCGWVFTDDSLVQDHVSMVHVEEGGATVVTIDHGDDQRTVEERFIRA